MVHLVVPAVIVQPEKSEGVRNKAERYHNLAAYGGAKKVFDLELVPFFEAGNRDPENYKDGVWSNSEPATRVIYQVWLPYDCGGNLRAGEEQAG